MIGEQPYIIKGIGGFYYVQTVEGVVECRAKGIFRKRKITPVAGDHVTLEQEAGTWVIAEIMPRKNVFVRPPVANVDQFFIVASTVEPSPSTLVIDKLSAIAVDKEAQPVLLITKNDLSDAGRLAANYRHAGFPVVIVDAAGGRGLNEVRAMLEGRISVFLVPGSVTGHIHSWVDPEGDGVQICATCGETRKVS